jgi:hypothetical protein
MYKTLTGKGVLIYYPNRGDSNTWNVKGIFHPTIGHEGPELE